VFDRCREFSADRDEYLDLWPREHFKGYKNITPMLTANRGWTTHGELEVGDQVFSPEGKPVLVIAKSPVFEQPPCFDVILQSGAIHTCTRDHEWRVIRKGKEKRDYSTGVPVRKMQRREEIVEVQDLKPGDNIGAITRALEYPEAIFPIDPYLLGVWLGDGDSSGPVFTKHRCDIQIIEEIRRCGYVVDQLAQSKNKNTSKWSVKTGPDGIKFRTWLSDSGLIGNKHIPVQYMSGSIHQRMSLLQGLMDTDGTSNGRGTATFVTIRKNLADSVMELARSLALRPRYDEVDALINGEPYRSYQIRFQHHEDRNFFRLERKAKKAIKPSLHRLTDNVVSVIPAPSVPSQCIQVEGGMYLAGRELIPTHNSTIITLAAAIQEILRDPEITIGIFSFSRPIAKQFLRSIKSHFEMNNRLKELFPNILWNDPQKEAPKWSEDDGIVVKRKGLPKEMTVEAWGLVDGQPTSKHYRLLIYDDAVVRESVTSAEMIHKVSEAMSLSFNLGSQMGNRKWAAGTRYHFADTYSEMIKRGAFKLRMYTATKDGKFLGEPVLWTREALAKKIKDQGTYVASCQLFNTPLMEGEQTFDPEWLEYWTVNQKLWMGMHRYILVDPANTKKKKSDYTVIAVFGLAADQNYYIIDFIRDKLSIAERSAKLMDLHRKYKPKRVGYESYGIQTDIDWVKRDQNEQGYRFPITPLGGNMSKEDRIKRLQPLFEEHRIYLPDKLSYRDYQGRTSDLVQAFVDDEYKMFPYMEHDDMLDDFARITDPDMKVSFSNERVVDEVGFTPKPKKDYDFETYDYLRAQ
jgi:predicted phage terminase large subunit-like protein